MHFKNYLIIGFNSNKLLTNSVGTDDDKWQMKKNPE